MPNRDDDIERIEALLRKPADSNPVTRIVIGFLVAAIICLLAFWYFISRTHSPGELKIVKLTNAEYVITVPKGAWYDTGIWVLPGKNVWAFASQGLNAGDSDPFTLAVDNTTVDARLRDTGSFWATVGTVKESSEKKFDDQAVVKNQGKIYVKVPSDTKLDS